MQQFNLQEIGDDKAFDPNDLYDGVPFTQARFYGQWQKPLGRVVRRFLIQDNDETVAYFQVIKYPLLFGKSYFYIPYGPVVQKFSEDLCAYMNQELKRIAKKENVIFSRLDFTPSGPSRTLSKIFTTAPLHTYHAAYFQPRAEWFLGLKKSEDELLMAMHEKTRYSIRLAGRKDVAAEIITTDFKNHFDVFYELLAETAKRNGFHLHKKSYYENIFQNLPPNSYLSVAKYDQKILAINLIIVFGGIANYVFGGSSTEERNRMPTYLAQWKAICYAKKLNCTHYNFGGISTEHKTTPSWDGLTFFKKRFGGKEVLHSDFFDVVVNPLWYRLYNFRKRIKQIKKS